MYIVVRTRKFSGNIVFNVVNVKLCEQLKLHLLPHGVICGQNIYIYINCLNVLVVSDDHCSSSEIYM